MLHLQEAGRAVDVGLDALVQDQLHDEVQHLRGAVSLSFDLARTSEAKRQGNLRVETDAKRGGVRAVLSTLPMSDRDPGGRPADRSGAPRPG